MLFLNFFGLTDMWLWHERVLEELSLLKILLKFCRIFRALILLSLKENRTPIFIFCWKGAEYSCKLIIAYLSLATSILCQVVSYLSLATFILCQEFSYLSLTTFILCQVFSYLLFLRKKGLTIGCCYQLARRDSGQGGEGQDHCLGWVRYVSNEFIKETITYFHPPPINGGCDHKF